MLPLQKNHFKIAGMKRNFWSITLIIVMGLLFSCNKKEIFNPNKYLETESLQEGAAALEIAKRFTYSDKNQLVTVWLKKDNTTLTFEYNKDKTIKKIMENNADSYALLSYDNKLITNIQYYKNNQLVQESIFSRKEKKNTINKIEHYVYDGFTPETKGVLFALLFPEAKNMPESLQKMHKSGEKSLYCVQNITYEGENIFRVRLDYGDVLYSTATYTYDEQKNPYYGLPYAFTDLTGYSKNNVKYARIALENSREKVMITLDNTYSYEKKYPTYKSVVESKTYAIAFDSNTPTAWATDVKYRSYQYAYK